MNNLLELREKLLNEVLMAREMFEHYFTLYNALITYAAEAQFAEVFFDVSLLALLECSTLKLCKIYDGDLKSFTLWEFLRVVVTYANTPGNNDKDSIMSICTDQLLSLHEIKEKLTLLKKLRNKALAHNDLKYFTCDDIWDDIGLTIKDYRELLEFPLAIVNDYNMLLDKPYEQFIHSNHQAEGVLKAIKHYLKCDNILDS
jgi:hypothetical protein